VMLCLAMLVAGELSAAITVAVSYACGAVLSLRLNPLPKPITARARRLVDGWMLVAVLMAQIYTSIDTMLLATFRSTRDAGVYAAVYRIPLAWVTVTGLLVSGMLPVTTEVLRTSRERLASMRARAVRVSAAAAVGLLAITPIAVLLVKPLFGAEYAEGGTPLALLLVATAISTVSAPLGALYLAVGSDRTFALMLTAGALVNVLANLVAIPAFGMVGAAATTVGSEALVLLLMWQSLRRIRQ
jgi:O-antigen/teichoic acid export membrane protein